MKTNAYLGLVLALGLAACGGSSSEKDEGETGGTGGGSIPIGASVDINGDGIADGKALDVNGDGIPESIDRNDDGKADGALPSGAMVVGGGDTGGVANTSTGGSNNNPGNTPISGVEDDGGTDNGGSTGTVVVETEVKLFCGASEVELDVTNGYVCCDSLSGGAWAKPTVIAAGECNTFSGPGSEKIPSKCDDKDDCGTSFCCFTYNQMGPPPTGPFAVPRAHGRRCLTEASCNAAMGAEGQSGVFSCNEVSDCPKTFSKCEAEEKGKTNADTVGRAWVKVCK